MTDIKIEVSVLKSAGELVNKVLGPAAEELGEGLADYVRAWRYNNLAEIGSKVRAIEALSGPVATEKIEPRAGVRLLTQAADESEDDLQHLWANLIYSAGNGQTASRVVTFSAVLHQLSSFDAQILSKIYSAKDGDVLATEVFTGELPDRVNVRKHETGASKGEDFDTELVPNEEVRFALGNLVRLGLLTFPTTWDGGELSASVYPTMFGYQFVKVCGGVA